MRLDRPPRKGGRSVVLAGSAVARDLSDPAGCYKSAYRMAEMQKDHVWATPLPCGGQGSAEHDRPASAGQDAALGVPLDGAGEDHRLDVAAGEDEVRGWHGVLH